MRGGKRRGEQRRSFAEIVKKDNEVELEPARKEMEELRVKAEQEMKEVVHVAVKETPRRNSEREELLCLAYVSKRGRGRRNW